MELKLCIYLSPQFWQHQKKHGHGHGDGHEEKKDKH